MGPAAEPEAEPTEEPTEEPAEEPADDGVHEKTDFEQLVRTIADAYHMYDQQTYFSAQLSESLDGGEGNEKVNLWFDFQVWYLGNEEDKWEDGYMVENYVKVEDTTNGSWTEVMTARCQFDSANATSTNV